MGEQQRHRDTASRPHVLAIEEPVDRVTSATEALYMETDLSAPRSDGRSGWRVTVFRCATPVSE